MDKTFVTDGKWVHQSSKDEGGGGSVCHPAINLIHADWGGHRTYSKPDSCRKDRTRANSHARVL